MKLAAIHSIIVQMIAASALNNVTATTPNMTKPLDFGGLNKRFVRLIIRKRNQLDQIATDINRDPEIDLKFSDILCRATPLAIIVANGLEPAIAEKKEMETCKYC